MTVEVVNCNTVTGFLDDKDKFGSCIEECFQILDEDRDGVLSKDEFFRGFDKVVSVGYGLSPKELNDIHENVFQRFDEDKNGALDPREFKSLVTEIMLATARGMGGTPVIVALDQGSLLMKAFQHESAGRKQ